MDRLATIGLRRVLPALFALGIACAALRYALRGLDWNAFRSQVHQLDWRWLLLAVLFDVSSYAAQGLRWRCLLQGSTLWQTTRAIYAGLFLNELVPFRPGEAVRAWLASRDLNIGLLSVAPTLFTERLMDGVWLAGALLAVLVLAPLPGFLVQAGWSVIAVVGVLLCAAWLLGRTRFGLFRKVSAGLTNAGALLASGCFLLAQGLAFWAVARASHLGVGLAAAFVVMVVVRMGTMIPAAPANVGTHQFATVLGLSLYGVPHPEAAGFSIVVFAVLTAPLLAIGFVACLSAGLNWKSIRRVANSGRPRNQSTQPGQPHGILLEACRITAQTGLPNSANGSHIRNGARP